MADDEKPENADDATATAAAGESQEKQERTFTQAELDAIVAKRVAKAEKATERRLTREPDPTTTQKKEPPPAPDSDLASEVAALKAKAAMAEAMAELEWKPSKEDAELLRDAFKSGGEAAMQKLAGRLKPNQETKPVDDPAAKKYRDPGAPSGAPPETLHNDAVKWSSDYVQRLVSEGSLTAELEKYRGGLPGGGGGLFRKRIPKVS